jgi:hypothetical protein
MPLGTSIARLTVAGTLLGKAILRLPLYGFEFMYCHRCLSCKEILIGNPFFIKYENIRNDGNILVNVT